jgi:membrane-bound lytic murein transglycosylase A
MRLRYVFLGLFLGGCATAPTPTPAPSPSPTSQAPTPTPQKKVSILKLSPEKAPDFVDDADTASLRTAALQSLTYYRSLPTDAVYTLASDTYTAADFAESTALFIDLMDQAASCKAWKDSILKNFQVYQSVGTDPQQTVTFSSYYEPMISARIKRTDKYHYPIYGRPSDLIDVDLGLFDPAYQGARMSGRRDGHKLVPYYTRAEIDSHHRIKQKARIVAWAKSPSDIFFLQIEGSGWLNLGGKKKLRIRYDGDNGRRYRSAGQYLIASGKVSSLSHDGFEEYLTSHPKERQSILNVNERYVFFRVDHSSTSAFAYGNLEVPLTAGRSIATDPKLFPKGALAWIATDHPVLDEDGVQTSTAPLTSFMLNQDEGGAIQGPGRVDFFAGEGPEALRFATHFWQKGQLYFLVKKKS